MRCKNDFHLKRSNKILQVVFRLSMSLSFNSYGTHFPAFWIFLRACKRLEIIPSSTPNAFANCFRVWVKSSSSNACNSASFNFFGSFPRSLLLRSKLTLLKRCNQSLNVVSDKSCSPQTFTRIRCLSAAALFEIKQWSKTSRKRWEFGTKLNIFHQIKNNCFVWNVEYCLMDIVHRFLIRKIISSGITQQLHKRLRLFMFEQRFHMQTPIHWKTNLKHTLWKSEMICWIPYLKTWRILWKSKNTVDNFLIWTTHCMRIIKSEKVHLFTRTSIRQDMVL